MRQDAREQRAVERLRRKAEPAGMGEAAARAEDCKIGDIQQDKRNHNGSEKDEQRARRRYGTAQSMKARLE